MAESKKRSGRRNPLELFNQDKNLQDKPNTDSKSTVINQDSIIINQESGKNNPESGIINQESRIINQNLGLDQSGLDSCEPLYPLSVRIPESLNDALDASVKKTRRTLGRKIPKEVLVSIAIEAMLQQVEDAGSWGSINSIEELRNLLGL